MEVKKSLTGASAVANSDDTSRVQICANSGENGLFAENLSLKLILTMALPITNIAKGTTDPGVDCCDQ